MGNVTMAKGNDERNNPNRKVGKLDTEGMSNSIGDMFGAWQEKSSRHEAALRSFEKNEITNENVHDIAGAIKYFWLDETQGGKYADFIKRYDMFMKGKKKGKNK